MLTATTRIYTDGHTLSLHDALPSLVALLQQVVGELVAERDADPPWPAGVIDQVEPDQLDFVAAVLGEVDHLEGLLRRRHDAAVALVEPFRRHAGQAAGGPAEVGRASGRERVWQYG